MTFPRMKKLLIQTGFVRKQQQSLRFTIQPAQGINAGWKIKERERALTGHLLPELGENSEGLVKGDQHFEENRCPEASQGDNLRRALKAAVTILPKSAGSDTKK
jgi:hypothetical protein